MADFQTPRPRWLVGEFRFNGTWFDSSVNANHATVSVNSYAKSDRHYQSRCLYGDGSTAYATIPNIAAYTSNALSICISIKRVQTSLPDQHYEIVGPYYGIQNDWCLTIPSSWGWFPGNKLTFAWYPWTGTGWRSAWHGMEFDINASDLLPVNEWVDIVVTRWASGLPSSCKGYVNGSLASTSYFWDQAPGWPVPSTRPVFWNWGGQWINAEGGCVRIHNVELTAEEAREFTLESLRQLWGGSFNSLNDWLRARYDFLGDANDVIGWNDGTVYSATPTSDRLWNANGAYFFNGSAFIELPYNADTSLFNDFSVEQWMSFPTSGWVKSISSNQFSIIMGNYWAGNSIQVLGSTIWTLPIGLSNGELFHLFFDKSSVYGERMWINGEPFHTESGNVSSIWGGRNFACIGATSYEGWHPDGFTGRIEETNLFHWTRVTDDRVKARYRISQNAKPLTFE